MIAVDAPQVAFVLTDSDIKQDAIVDYVNQILKTGEITDLYTRDEFEALCIEVAPIMQRAGIYHVDDRNSRSISCAYVCHEKCLKDVVANAIGIGACESSEHAYKFFINRVKCNLHIVLCMSPGGNTLMRRAQQFPGLVSGTYVDWYMPWPTDALALVAHEMLHDLNLPSIVSIGKVCTI